MTHSTEVPLNPVFHKQEPYLKSWFCFILVFLSKSNKTQPQCLLRLFRSELQRIIRIIQYSKS